MACPWRALYAICPDPKNNRSLLCLSVLATFGSSCTVPFTLDEIALFATAPASAWYFSGAIVGLALLVFFGFRWRMAPLVAEMRKACAAVETLPDAQALVMHLPSLDTRLGGGGCWDQRGESFDRHLYCQPRQSLRAYLQPAIRGSFLRERHCLQRT